MAPEMIGGFVGDDAPGDVEAVLAEEPLERRRRSVLANAGVDTVRDGEDGSLHSCSLVFSTSRTSSTTMPLSTAFAMSYTRESGDGRSDERLHLDAGLGGRLGGRLDHDGVLADVERHRRRASAAAGDRAG